MKSGVGWIMSIQKLEAIGMDYDHSEVGAMKIEGAEMKRSGPWDGWG